MPASGPLSRSACAAASCTCRIRATGREEGTPLDVNRNVAIYRARPALPPVGELGTSSSRRRPARTHVR